MTDMHDDNTVPNEPVQDAELELALTEDVPAPADDAEPDVNLGTVEAEQDIDLNFGMADEPEAEPETELNLDFDDDEADAAEEEEAGVDLGMDDEPEQEAEDLEPDEELQAALAELKERLDSSYGDWYVIHTYSGMENRVKQNLDSRVKTLNMEDFIFESVVPTEQEEEIRGNQKKLVTRTVLPGYVLVRMELTDESWSTVRHTPSVTGFVGHAQNPVPIGIDEVYNLLEPSVRAKVAQANAGKPVRRKTRTDFNVGDSVQVDDGAFAGVHATIMEVNASNQRVKVLVEFMGREMPMDLTFAQIKKI